MARNCITTEEPVIVVIIVAVKLSDDHLSADDLSAEGLSTEELGAEDLGAEDLSACRWFERSDDLSGQRFETILDDNRQR